jgi:hypothetical protein
MMNMSQILSNMSDESLLSIGIFGIALFFYVSRRVSTLKSQITLYEQADKTSRESLEDDLRIMNGIMDDLRMEYSSLQQGLEKELVAHEMTSLSLNPQFKRIELLISSTLNKQSKTLIDLDRNIKQISASVSRVTFSGPNSGIVTMNELFPKMIDKVRSLSENSKSHSLFVHEMQRDLEIVKRACGVE